MRCIVVSLCGVFWAACHTSAAIVINEIHYNPDVKTDPGEFVELYNSGTNTVNLAGWAFTDGINYTFPPINLAPGGYVVEFVKPLGYEATTQLNNANTVTEIVANCY